MTKQDKELRQNNPAASPTREIAVRFIGRSQGPIAQSNRDQVAVEGPLEIRLHGKPATVLLRTPGNDEELALGFLFHEGIITHRNQILALERPEFSSERPEFFAERPESASERPETPLPDQENVLFIKLDAASRGKSLNRFFYSTSSCGACGKNSLESLEVQGQRPLGNFTVTPALLSRMVNTMRERQSLFQQTGGVHGCSLFDPLGNFLALREDVGRHNALDKLTGFSLSQGWVPLTDRILVLSGRIGYEMVQKAVVAGIPMIVAVGAPTSLAVEIADRFGITLVGFLRGETMNVYAHPERVTETQSFMI